MTIAASRRMTASDSIRSLNDGRQHSGNEAIQEFIEPTAN
jgi:hypothetical protein